MICRISKAFLPQIGGMEKHIYFLSMYQFAMGHTIFVLQPHCGGVIKDGITIRKVPMGLFVRHLGTKFGTLAFSIIAAIQCWRLHYEKPIDIIHLHGDVIEAFTFGLLGYFIKVPVILTLHGRLNKRRFYRIVGQWMFKLIEKFIAVSKDIKSDLISLGIASEKIEVISSGVKIDEFLRPKEHIKSNLRQRLGLPANCNIVISVGNLDSMKGFEYLIKAAKKITTDNIFFIIVGDGPERKNLFSMAKGLSNLRLVGTKPHDEVIQYLCCADVFVLPSVDLPGKAEGTPTALMEAMAAGLPVITTDSGGAKYLIKDGINGYMVPQRDSVELADAICKLLDDPTLCEKMGKMNQEAAKQKDWSIIAQKVTRVYLKLLECGIYWD